MTNLAEQQTVPQAATRRSRRFSIIWIVPLVAVAIGAWLAWDTLSKEGPTIKISFDSGEGLQAGQSQLKYKEIVFGTVKSLELSPDKWRGTVSRRPPSRRPAANNWPSASALANIRKS
jgi:paraquat-inducible protein B